MAKSKFAGLFEKQQNGSDAVSHELAPARMENEPRVPQGVRPIGRPPGKRSDPAWKQYSVLLRRETQRRATDLLRAEGEGGRDLSGLLQELLEQWVNKRR